MFDGFRTSHEYRNIEELGYGAIASIADLEAIQEFRDCSPAPPVRRRGTAQNPDIYPGAGGPEQFYLAAPLLSEAICKNTELTGRAYRPFDYYGPPDAKDVIIAMGSVCGTVRRRLVSSNRGVKAACWQSPHRPFGKYFFEALPGVERIAVLDGQSRVHGEPLYLDVCSMFSGLERRHRRRYGLGSKDTTPQQYWPFTTI